MDIVDIRRENIKYLADTKHGRLRLSEMVGYQDANYINQLCGGFGNFGNRTARKIELKLGLERGWMDNLHPEIYGESFDSQSGASLKELWEASSPEERAAFLSDLAKR
jgi:hypothetical protein